LILLFLLFLVVKIPYAIRAGNNTVFTADAPPEVLYNNSIITAVGSFGRTHHNTRGLIAVHTGHGDNLHSGGRILTLFSYGQYPVPVYLPALLLLLG
jgi:hypothetical protein